MSGISSEELPDRKIVPLKVEYGNNEITITSNNDNVNTTLAYHDIFSSSSDITHRNNLMYVNKGTTVIKMRYPYLWQGALVSAEGTRNPSIAILKRIAEGLDMELHIQFIPKKRT